MSSENEAVFFAVDGSISHRFLARAYDYGRKGHTDFAEDVEDDSDLGMTGSSDYFTRGEGSRNFTFGGRTIEERAPRDDDDDEDEDDDDGLLLVKHRFSDRDLFSL